MAKKQGSVFPLYLWWYETYLLFPPLPGGLLYSFHGFSLRIDDIGMVDSVTVHLAT